MDTFIRLRVQTLGYLFISLMYNHMGLYEFRQLYEMKSAAYCYYSLFLRLCLKTIFSVVCDAFEFEEYDYLIPRIC